MTLQQQVEVTAEEARQELRAAFMEIQRIKRNGPDQGEGVMPPIWRAINAIPAALYHLDKMPEFEADLAAEEADVRQQSLPDRNAILEEAAKVAEQDRRSDMAKDVGYSPEWHKLALCIATEIRNRKIATALAKRGDMVSVPRVPTEAMIRALDKGLHDKWPNARAMALACWEHMLTAALAEGKTS